MRKLVLFTVLLALAILPGAQPAAAQSGDEAAMAQAVETFRKAMLANDRTQFEALCADQMSYGHSGGRIETKKQFIDDATSGKSVWKSLNLADQSIQIVGNNAIVRNILTGDLESGGKITPIKIGILWVWLKQDGRWKLLARQAYKL
jgi:ketosteroid isomerase-like protein